MVAVLHAEICLARRYFYPGVHRMEPYASLMPMASRWLSQTEALCERILVLPTGTAMTSEMALLVCELVRIAISDAPEVKRALTAA